MKKILTTLLAAAMLIAAPSAIFADEYQDLKGAQTATVKLKATIASSFYVRLPKEVSVEQATTRFTILAKGDVDAAKQIVFSEYIKEGDDCNYIADESNKNEPVEITVTPGDPIKGVDVGADYNDQKGSTMKVFHDKLNAGTWSCQLPIVISLEDVTQ